MDRSKCVKVCQPEAARLIPHSINHISKPIQLLRGITYLHVTFVRRFQLITSAKMCHVSMNLQKNKHIIFSITHSTWKLIQSYTYFRTIDLISLYLRLQSNDWRRFYEFLFIFRSHFWNKMTIIWN